VIVLLARGGPDTIERLRKDARRTARRFAPDGRPLLGISVAAAVDVPLDDLLCGAPFARFADVYTPTAAQLRAFELLPTFRRPHFTVRLQRADYPELDQLLSALRPLRANPGYARDTEG
jgi:hypothetical protein